MTGERAAARRGLQGQPDRKTAFMIPSRKYNPGDSF
jgi:hypothetical protein